MRIKLEDPESPRTMLIARGASAVGTSSLIGALTYRILTNLDKWLPELADPVKQAIWGYVYLGYAYLTYSLIKGEFVTPTLSDVKRIPRALRNLVSRKYTENKTALAYRNELQLV